MQNNKIIIAILLMVLFHSCYYDATDLLYPAAGKCDTLTTVSYTKNIIPLFQQQCYGCHNGVSPSGGIAMGNYNADKAIAVNGKLYGSISYASGYSPMPKGMAKMSSCQLQLIKKWIDAGSPNN